MHTSPRPGPPLGVALGLVVLGITSVQLGAGFAKLLFDDIAPNGVVWLRLATSSLVLMLWARPRMRGRSRTDWLIAIRYGVCLAAMNWGIYQSFSRIPLGVAVTIEFVGPMTLAIIGFRRARDLLWVALAGLGVVLLGFERTHLDPLGVFYAVLAGAAWAGYIVSSAETGRRWEGIDGLAVASLVGVLVMTPLLVTVETSALTDPRILALGAAVGLLSSVIPYSAELAALRTVPAATFGVLMSLEPAAAALSGLVVVGESLATVQWLAIACVVIASVGATRATRASHQVDVPPPA